MVTNPDTRICFEVNQIRLYQAPNQHDSNQQF